VTIALSAVSVLRLHSIYSYNAHNSRTEHCRAWNPATAQSPV